MINISKEIELIKFIIFDSFRHFGKSNKYIDRNKNNKAILYTTGEKSLTMLNFKMKHVAINNIDNKQKICFLLNLSIIVEFANAINAPIQKPGHLLYRHDSTPILGAIKQ